MAYKINGTTVVDNSRNVCACCVTSCCITASDRMDVPSGDTASRPGSPATGSLYFDTDEGGLVAYNGTEWASIGAAEGVAKYGLLHGIDENRLQSHWVSYGNNYSHVGSKMGAQSQWYTMSCSGRVLEGCHYYCTPEATHEKTGRCLFLLCWFCCCLSPNGNFGSASNSCFSTPLGFKAHGWMPSIHAGEYDSSELATPMFHMSDGNRQCTSKPNTIGFLRKGSNGCYFLQGKCLCPSTCCCFCWMQHNCSAWRCHEMSSGDAMGRYGSYHKMGSNFSCCKYLFNFSTQADTNPVANNNCNSLATIMNCWCPTNLHNDVCTAPSGNQCMSQHESCWTDTRIFFGGVLRSAYNCKCKRLWFANNKRLTVICAAADGQFSYCSCFTDFCMCDFAFSGCYFGFTNFNTGAAKCDGTGFYAANQNGIDPYLIDISSNGVRSWYFKGGVNSNTNCKLFVHFTQMDCDGCIHVYLNQGPTGTAGRFQFYQLILNGCGGLENNSSPAVCVLTHRLRLTNATAGATQSCLCCWETFESPQVSKGWVGGSMRTHGGLNLLTGLIGGYNCSQSNSQHLNEVYPAGNPCGPSSWTTTLNYPIGFAIPASLKTAGTISDGSNGICWITVNCGNKYRCSSSSVNDCITACVQCAQSCCQKCAGKFCNNCGYSLFLGYRLGDKCCDLGNGENGLKGTTCGCGSYKNCCAGPNGYKDTSAGGISRDTLSL